MVLVDEVKSAFDLVKDFWTYAPSIAVGLVIFLFSYNFITKLINTEHVDFFAIIDILVSTFFEMFEPYGPKQIQALNGLSFRTITLPSILGFGGGTFEIYQIKDNGEIFIINDSVQVPFISKSIINGISFLMVAGLSLTLFVQYLDYFNKISRI